MTSSKQKRSEAIPPKSAADRYLAGKKLRQKTPRERHAEMNLSSKRDPLAVLAETDRVRLPELVPLRYQRMSADPFAFLRGAAAVMAEDLKHAPMAGAPVQACGDCHIGNFGVEQSPEGGLLFDINDFDETLPGIDFTLDVKRLAASVALAAQASPQSSKTEARAAVSASVRAYRTRMAELAKLSPLDVWAARTNVAAIIERISDEELKQRLQAFIGQTHDSGGSGDLPLAAGNKGEPPSSWRIADKPPNVFHWPTESDSAHTVRAEEAFRQYHRSLPVERRGLVERYALCDVAFKVVGIGSVGTFCAVGLFTTADGATLFLQIKEALPSALIRLVGHDPFARGNQGERVVEGQRIMQAASDVFLGWTADSYSKRQFYVRHLKNRKLGEIAPLIQDHAIAAYGELCGATLARAHARSGDPSLIAGYMGQSTVFDEAITTFALDYGAQTANDHAALVAKHPVNKTASGVGANLP